MEEYYIGFYTSNGNDKIKGNWKTSKEEVDEETESYLYKVKLGYTRTGVGNILKSRVEELAKEHNISVGDVLSCL